MSDPSWTVLPDSLRSPSAAQRSCGIASWCDCGIMPAACDPREIECLAFESLSGSRHPAALQLRDHRLNDRRDLFWSRTLRICFNRAAADRFIGEAVFGQQAL